MTMLASTQINKNNVFTFILYLWIEMSKRRRPTNVEGYVPSGHEVPEYGYAFEDIPEFTFEAPASKKTYRNTDVVIIPEDQLTELTTSSYVAPFMQAVPQAPNAMSKDKGNRLPRDKYAASLSREELEKRYVALGDKTKKRKGGTSKKGGAKRRRYSSGRGSRYSGGTNIVYPNVVGRGAYELKGGLNFGHEGDWLRGGIGGYYNSDPVVSGRGAYNIKRNSLWEGQGPPMIENITNGPVVIRHREYIGDMTCPTGAPSPYDIFFQQPINPGNPEMFPWLSQLAPMFQEWEAVGMIFEIKTMSSDYTSNVSMGTIFAAADYNVQATAPANKQQLENMEYSQSCKPSCSILMPIECSPSKTVATHLYIAPNLDYGNGDPQFYDLAQVFLGSQGLPNSGGAVGTIAELWVSYEIILYKPKISIIADSGEEAGFYIANPTVDSPLGTSTTVPFQGNQSPFITLDRFAQTVYLPPVPNQTYTIDYYLCADTMTGTVPDANIMHFTTTLANCTSTGLTFYPSGGSSPLIAYFNSSTDTTVTGGTSQYEGYVQSQIVTTDATAGPNNIPSINFSEFSAWPTTMVNPNAVVIVQHTGLKFV